MMAHLFGVSLSLVPQVAFTALVVVTARLGLLGGLSPFFTVACVALWAFTAAHLIEGAHRRRRGVDPSPATAEK